MAMMRAMRQPAAGEMMHTLFKTTYPRSFSYQSPISQIMEGRGVTNYSTEKPAFAFSTRTTEFDDALVERNIVTLEQAFMAKGASEKEAQRLAALKRASR